MNELPFMTPEGLESINFYLESEKEDEEQEASDLSEIAEASTILD